MVDDGRWRHGMGCASEMRRDKMVGVPEWATHCRACSHDRLHTLFYRPFVIDHAECSWIMVGENGPYLGWVARCRACNHDESQTFLSCLAPVQIKKYKDEQVLLAEDQAWMESSSDSDQEINVNMVFMAQIEKVLSDSEASSSSADEKISEVSYYLSESESESEYETSEYYDNSTNYGLFMNNDDD
nr:hypothetical protein [Tanacetum cinerariifolium]